MIQTLSVEILRFRQAFLGQIRAFFDSRGYLEVQTPALNPTGAVEPFIDSFQVHATGDRKSPAGPSGGTEGYLITSPEYNLKTVLAASPLPIYEICHSFRAGDVGAEHTEEFLMLEWYRPGATESDLILETNSLLVHLAGSFPLPSGLRIPATPRTISIGDLFARGGIGGLGRDVLERAGQAERAASRGAT
jgi:lysyl-tRNA synthetase class 2